MKLKTLHFCIVLASVLLFSCSTGNQRDAVTDIIDLDEYYQGFDGAFMLFDEGRNRYLIYNEEQIDERLSPCSTFKIPNSLIGLESGAIKGRGHLYEWDGTTHAIQTWNQDHTLETAIRESVVWYYQRLAQEVGEEQMQVFLNQIDYGNKDISGGLTSFWLSSSLKISAREQVAFLKQLNHFELPFSQENMQLVKEILVLESKAGLTLYGKTGTGRDGLGWFVGMVEKDGQTYYFAVNIIGEQATGVKAQEITINVLKHLGIDE